VYHLSGNKVLTVEVCEGVRILQLLLTLSITYQSLNLWSIVGLRKVIQSSPRPAHHSSSSPSTVKVRK
jgi:hypothetical protein